jgi:hypothetical protein
VSAAARAKPFTLRWRKSLPVSGSMPTPTAFPSSRRLNWRNCCGPRRSDQNGPPRRARATPSLEPTLDDVDRFVIGTRLKDHISWFHEVDDQFCRQLFDLGGRQAFEYDQRCQELRICRRYRRGEAYGASARANPLLAEPNTELSFTPMELKRRP